MIWPFSKNQKSALPEKLVFKSGKAFFDYQCMFGHTDIIPNRGVVALVLDSKKEFGTIAPIKIEADGQQIVTLKVASEDGGFVVHSQTPTGIGDRLSPDDVVIWLPLEYTSIVNELDGIDPRFGWLGFVVAKIKPELDMSKPDFDITCWYDQKQR